MGTILGVSIPSIGGISPSNRSLDPKTMTHNPAFLVVATRGSARRLGTRLASHALTQVVSSVAEARPLLRAQERWLGWWVDGVGDQQHEQKAVRRIIGFRFFAVQCTDSRSGTCGAA